MKSAVKQAVVTATVLLGSLYSFYSPTSGVVASDYWGSPSAKENFAWSSHRMVMDDYARTQSLHLYEQLSGSSLDGQVAIATTVPLHGDVTRTHWFGEQYAQALQQHLGRLSIPVIETKLDQYLRFTPQGEVALTRDFRTVRAELGVNYVIVSQWIARDHGMQVTTRMVRASDQRVMATASQTIPAVVIERSYPTDAAE